MFLIVDDVAAERRRLQGRGIVLGDDIEGDYSTLAQVRDPDGLGTGSECPTARHDTVHPRRSGHGNSLEQRSRGTGRTPD